MENINERQAIYLEMQELKEQGRRDFDMYFELRKHRNERYTQLQNRLREIDNKERENKPTQIAPTTQLVGDYPQKQISMHQDAPQQPRILSPTPTKVEQYVADKKKDVITRKKSKKPQMPIEKIVPKIVEYLEWSEGNQKTKDIQQYCETQLEYTWANFSSILKSAMEKSPRIEKVSHGVYRIKED